MADYECIPDRELDLENKLSQALELLRNVWTKQSSHQSLSFEELCKIREFTSQFPE